MMVDAVRTTEKALGDVSYGAGEREAKSLVFRRSLFVVQDMKKGDLFTAKNVRSIRPGQVLHPRHLPQFEDYDQPVPSGRGGKAYCYPNSYLTFSAEY